MSEAMRTIGVITAGRSDYGIYLPVLRRIRACPDLRLHLVVTGSHLAGDRGKTIDAIRRDGFAVGDCVDMLPASDTARGVAEAMGNGTKALARIYARRGLDLLLVLGDRFEMHAAVAAAVPFSLPVAHLHGGEITEGAMDELFRHSISKMSRLHFAATKTCRDRLLRMGEEPWRVKVTGAPALDNLRELRLMTRSQVEKKTGMKFDPSPLLATFHPVTLEQGLISGQIEEVLAALDRAGLPVLFTYPNVDMGSGTIIRAVRRYVAAHPACRVAPNLGTPLYFSVMKYAAAMVGNSSSGIIEAATFGLPVVNIGNRQGGRVHGRNVIDVACQRARILAAIRRVTGPAFRRKIRGMRNPYGDGHAAGQIVRILRTIPLNQRLVVKKFRDGRGRG